MYKRQKFPVFCPKIWSPYILGACEAVLSNRRIEDCVSGNVHGNDIGAGFEKGWVEMLELNSHIAAEESLNVISRLTNEFINGKKDVFKGDYIGVDTFNESNTCDLNGGFIENSTRSAPMFGYVLKDVITVLERPDGCTIESPFLSISVCAAEISLRHCGTGGYIYSVVVFFAYPTELIISSISLRESPFSIAETLYAYFPSVHTAFDILPPFPDIMTFLPPISAVTVLS